MANSRDFVDFQENLLGAVRQLRDFLATKIPKTLEQQMGYMESLQKHVTACQAVMSGAEDKLILNPKLAEKIQNVLDKVILQPWNEKNQDLKENAEKIRQNNNNIITEINNVEKEIRNTSSPGPRR